MLVLGLTGSLGMGKSTCAAMFAEKGVAIFDADATVHALYRSDAVPLVEAAFPGTMVDGVIDRNLLAKKVVGDSAAIARLEKIVHPLVRDAENLFRAKAKEAGTDIILLDIPLLFENHIDDRVDVVILVSTTPEIQKERVLGRPGMSEERFTALLAKQMPDQEKRRHAHFIIDTSGELTDTRRQVDDVFRAVAGMAAGR
jgi:dephospho-CoA kinase